LNIGEGPESSRPATRSFETRDNASFDRDGGNAFGGVLREREIPVAAELAERPVLAFKASKSSAATSSGRCGSALRRGLFGYDRA
jgi:hypothetical protein